MEAIALAPSSSLVNDLLEEIFLRLPAKSLVRLKSLSKHWRWTIESNSFVKRHLKIAVRSHMDHPKLIAVSDSKESPLTENSHHADLEIFFRTICKESAPILSVITLPIAPDGYQTYVSESCDGLFCIYFPKSLYIYVVNPATRWVRQLPPARIQILIHKLMSNLEGCDPTVIPFRTVLPHYLAFVKATDYKLVWLYNSDSVCPNEGLIITKCEVFDFNANAWRYLACSPSYYISHDHKPACVNRSIYWLTEPNNVEIKVVAFDIHTEKFRLLPKIHPVIATSDPYQIKMCTLDNCLCMMRNEDQTKLKEIWRLKSLEDMWEKIYTIDFRSYSSSWSHITNGFYWTSVAICMKNKIFFSSLYSNNLVEYDPQTKSFCSVFRHPNLGVRYVPYFQSLISHI